MSAEKFLKVRRVALEVLLNQSIDPVIIIDSEGKAVFYNRAAEKLLGYQPEEVLNKEIHLILAPKEYHEAYKRGIEKFKKEGKGKVLNKVLELEALTKDKKLIPIELSVSKIKVNDEYFALGIIRDLSKTKKLQQDLADLFKGILLSLKKLMELRDLYTAEHQRRVTNLAIRLAKHLKIDKERLKSLYVASVLHDIGKMIIPMAILNKPSKLSSPEFEIVKLHPYTGYLILKELNFMPIAAKIVLQHHERLDGSGYPEGLKDENILPEAKILGVADVVVAMYEHRPYRPSLGLEKAIEEITQKAKILYDPQVVETCVKFYKTKKLQKFIEEDINFLEILGLK